MPRKPISASLRWSIFARDGFRCRFCGAQAGSEGVTLAVDHLVSVKDGGDNGVDNLLTACQRCNGGKAARSLRELPSSPEAAARSEATAANMEQMRTAIESELAARKKSLQSVVNMKCDAYQVDSVKMQRGEEGVLLNLCREFGAERVQEWLEIAYRKGVPEWPCIKYVCGIARKVRAEQGPEGRQ